MTLDSAAGGGVCCLSYRTDQPERRQRMGEFGKYVLVETWASERQGRTLYFKQMTAIGPMTTASLGEAQRFASLGEASTHPATWHAMANFEAREAGAEVSS